MPARQRSSKLRGPEYLTAIAALALFISTFGAWFKLPSLLELRKLAPDAVVVGGGGEGAIGLNVWDLSVTRWFLYLALLCCAWMVLSAIFSETPQWAVTLATPAVIFSGLTAIGLLVRLIDPPRAGADPTALYYLAVVSAVAMFAGACWSLRDDFVPAGYRKAPPPEELRVDPSE